MRWYRLHVWRHFLSDQYFCRWKACDPLSAFRESLIAIFTMSLTSISSVKFHIFFSTENTSDSDAAAAVSHWSLLSQPRSLKCYGSSMLAFITRNSSAVKSTTESTGLVICSMMYLVNQILFWSTFILTRRLLTSVCTTIPPSDPRAWCCLWHSQNPVTYFCGIIYCTMFRKAFRRTPRFQNCPATLTMNMNPTFRALWSGK